jgi:hyaluronoglucosaminidase
VDDVDYFDNVIVEYSKDGEEWFALTEPMEGVYDILWQGEPFEARYVGIRKLESKKRNWLAIREFAINPVDKSEYGWDANPFTAYTSAEALNIAIKEGATTLRLLLGALDKELCYEVKNAKGEVLSNGTITSPEQVISLPEGATTLHLAGKTTLYEAIAK